MQWLTCWKYIRFVSGSNDGQHEENMLFMKKTDICLSDADIKLLKKGSGYFFEDGNEKASEEIFNELYRKYGCNVMLLDWYLPILSYINKDRAIQVMSECGVDSIGALVARTKIFLDNGKYAAAKKILDQLVKTKEAMPWACYFGFALHAMKFCSTGLQDDFDAAWDFIFTFNCDGEKLERSLRRRALSLIGRICVGIVRRPDGAELDLIAFNLSREFCLFEDLFFNLCGKQFREPKQIALLQKRKKHIVSFDRIKSKYERLFHDNDLAGLRWQGILHFINFNVSDEDYEKAYEFFSKAVSLGDVESEGYLGFIFNMLGKCHFNPEKATDLLYEGAGEGDMASIRFLAKFSLASAKRFLEYKDIEKSRKFLDRAVFSLKCGAASYDSACMSELGCLYASGSDIVGDNADFNSVVRSVVRKDKVKATKFLKEAMDLGDCNAVCFFGMMLLEEKKPRKSKNKTCKSKKDFFDISEMEGLGFSNLPASYLYVNPADDLQADDMIDEKEVEGLSYIKKSAESGSVLGMYKLGCCYSDGTGTKRNYKEALKWLEKSINFGGGA